MEHLLPSLPTRLAHKRSTEDVIDLRAHRIHHLRPLDCDYQPYCSATNPKLEVANLDRDMHERVVALISKVSSLGLTLRHHLTLRPLPDHAFVVAFSHPLLGVPQSCGGQELIVLSASDRSLVNVSKPLHL